ncbi:hypothetical protein Rxycam_02499 [Rubrobacter xylanophilus DSM 9941]|uniref:PDGLE domain-containing protein n=1 Tax=Rubrobacter xylanophilus TaxID=49319 RepID=A0A510HLT9_9ACTN|nr:PDGLE domain-containing protein [Rubrobacter xylanophilus]QYJ16664.1 hypothetical protein Rxycam_02499 [Rubrobacter xylanophilus DSM 9941]BBL80970.1 hypothetical protein RxyAA322_28240 [Rubrobacter xylanophilus]
MGPSAGRSTVAFVLAGLAVTLLIAVVLSNFAAGTPDALQRAIIESACRGAPDEEACLARHEGDPVLKIAPRALLDYRVTWLSGLVGVAATFLVGAGIVALLRISGGPRGGTSGHRLE